MYKIDFKFMNDFNSELISQQLIFDYFENKFFSDFSKTVKILSLPETDEEKIFTDNQNFINIINNKIESYIENNQIREFVELLEWVKNVDQREPLGEIINFIIESLENGEKIDKIVLQLKKLINEINQQNNNKDYNIKDIEKCVNAALIIVNNNNFNKIEENINYLESFRSCLRIFDILEASNIYRQSFINVVSIFDALIFDILKNYFMKNIKLLENFFNSSVNKLKIDFQDIIKFNNFQELKAFLVNLKFEQVYLSKIIKYLNNFDNAFFEDNEFEQLLEIINIRNIHIHNKGVIDKKFLDEGYNLKKFKLGQTAVIDKSFLFDVFKILSSIYSKIDKKFNTKLKK